MRLSYDDATEAFRAELNDWLDRHCPVITPETVMPRSSADMVPWVRQWQRALFDHGWLVPGWTPERGGRNATPVQSMVYLEEMARRPVQRTYNPQGLSIITPSLFDYGSAEQIERWGMPSLKGEISWCLGMSEPDAGSDLAGLKTRAEVFDSHFVVNGQKVWTSGAHHADWCWCFVRTDAEAAKHKGISVILVDMRSEGVRIRPLAGLLDREENDFNEVFFTDVVVPRSQLIGQLGQGWSIANGSLAHERGMMWLTGALALHGDVDRAIRECQAMRSDGTRLGDDPRVRDRVASAYIDSQAMMAMGYKGFAKFAKGMVSPEHSVLKLFGSESVHRLREDMTSVVGAAGIDLTGQRFLRGMGANGPWPVAWLGQFGSTISAGASEIQRNIIAERVLGLPRR